MSQEQEEPKKTAQTILETTAKKASNGNEHAIYDMMSADQMLGMNEEEVKAFLARDVKKMDSEERRKRKYLEQIQKNPEVLKMREEIEAEFLEAHPELAALSKEDRHKAMVKHDLEDEKIRRQKLRSHLETFSDGVIAIIITIMLLEIPVPHNQVGYGDFLINVGIFLISFVITANFWYNRHQTFAVTEEITERILVFDFLFMAALSILPLLTKWVMVAPNWIASLNYGLLIMVILCLQESISYYVTKARFRKQPKTFAFWRRVWASRLGFSLIINFFIMLIALWQPVYGHWLFIIVPIFNFLFRGVGADGEDFTVNVDEGRVNGRPRF